MSGPFGSSQWMYSSGGFYGFPIEQSLRFNDNDSAYLSRTPASAGDRKTWTWSGWVKRGRLAAPDQGLFEGNLNFDGSNYFSGIRFLETGELIAQDIASGSYNLVWQTSAVYRDTSAWYHIVVSYDTTQASSSDAVGIYVNGVQQDITFTAYVGSYSQNRNSYVNATNPHAIGTIDAANYFDGYIAEVNFIDGQALNATSFGEFKSGVWIPKEYGGTYGTNGFRLSFADSANIGDDTSGNTNDWTANSLVATDVLLDSPTNNFCVINAVDNTGATLAEGNLRFTPTSDFQFAQGTFACSKNYFEVLFVGTLGGSIEDSIYGVYSYNGNNTTINGAGQIYKDGSLVSSNTAYVAGDILGVAVDVSSNTIQFYRNGSTNGSSTLNANVEYMPHFKNANGRIGHANFGQDSSFAGNKTAQGNTDDNGIGDFYYAPPSGYLALCTANLPDPVIDPAQDDVPSDYFNTVTYSGTSATHVINGIGFQPDLTWIKARTVGGNHYLTDAVRGTTKGLQTNLTASEVTNTDVITSFNSDGFTLGTDATSNNANISGRTYVGWSWLAGNGTSSNTDGSITSTVSVNQKAGFSIVSYTGNGTNGATVGHGLGVTPSMWITKNRSSGTADWVVKTSDMASNEWLRFTNSALLTTLTGNTANSTVITTGGNTVDNASGQDFITYAFAEVEGYSKIGSFVGNGSTDGPFIFLGHSPSFLLIKNTSSLGEWMLYDSARSTFNPIDKELYANASDTEATVNRGDMLSNGVKIRSTSTSLNTSGNTYIYLSFASNPFKYANAR